MSNVSLLGPGKGARLQELVTSKYSREWEGGLSENTRTPYTVESWFTNLYAKRALKLYC